MKRLLVALMCLALVVCLLPASSPAEEKLLMMATTTSTDNTGLLDYLAPKFKEATGIELKWTATGTGKALKLGENCDVDILMVHAPPAEKKFVADGFGTDRREIMYNDFVIIGPAEDAAGIKGKSIKEALQIDSSEASHFCQPGRQFRNPQKGTFPVEGGRLAGPGKGELVCSDRPGYAGDHQYRCGTQRVHDDRPGDLHQI